MAKKVIDKWKSKTWYSVVAPDLFDRKVITDIIATDPEKLLNRKVKITLDMLTGNYAFPNPYVLVSFKIIDVKGNNCFTKYVGHELVFSYISTIVRKRKCIIDHVVHAQSRDGVKAKVKMLILSQNKVSRQTRTQLRHAIDDFVLSKMSNQSFDEFIKSVLFSKLNVELYEQLKKIVQISKIEFRKIELAKVRKKRSEKKQENEQKDQSKQNQETSLSIEQQLKSSYQQPQKS